MKQIALVLTAVAATAGVVTRLAKTCFPCHAAIKARDFVFTRYAP